MDSFPDLPEELRNWVVANPETNPNILVSPDTPKFTIDERRMLRSTGLWHSFGVYSPELDGWIFTEVHGYGNPADNMEGGGDFGFVRLPHSFNGKVVSTGRARVGKKRIRFLTGRANASGSAEWLALHTHLPQITQQFLANCGGGLISTSQGSHPVCQAVFAYDGKIFGLWLKDPPRAAPKAATRWGLARIYTMDRIGEDTQKLPWKWETPDPHFFNVLRFVIREATIADRKSELIQELNGWTVGAQNGKTVAAQSKDLPLDPDGLKARAPFGWIDTKNWCGNAELLVAVKKRGRVSTVQVRVEGLPQHWDGKGQVILEGTKPDDFGVLLHRFPKPPYYEVEVKVGKQVRVAGDVFPDVPTPDLNALDAVSQGDQMERVLLLEEALWGLWTHDGRALGYEQIASLNDAVPGGSFQREGRMRHLVFPEEIQERANEFRALGSQGLRL